MCLLMGFTGAILNRDADPPWNGRLSSFDRYYNERARRLTFLPVLRVGHRLTAVTPSPGIRNSNRMCGTWITGVSG
jgi:hypothetical protein